MATWIEEREQAALRLVAGTPVKGEYRCVGCGYGAIVYRELPRCPMCGEEEWEQLEWSPFGRAVDPTQPDDWMQPSGWS